jgi:addiction module HigA family antidote
MRLPYSPPHPGELLLEDFLKPMNITQIDFAKHIGVSFKRVNEIVNGKRGITPETAILFAQAFGNTPQFWLNVQNTHDLAHVKTTQKVRRLRGQSEKAMQLAGV